LFTMPSLTLLRLSTQGLLTSHGHGFVVSAICPRSPLRTRLLSLVLLAIHMDY
jgi:hypothetical protein